MCIRFRVFESQEIVYIERDIGESEWVNVPWYVCEEEGGLRPAGGEQRTHSKELTFYAQAGIKSIQFKSERRSNIHVLRVWKLCLIRMYYQSNFALLTMDRESVSLQIENMKFQAKMERWPLSKSIEA